MELQQVNTTTYTFNKTRRLKAIKSPIDPALLLLRRQQMAKYLKSGGAISTKI